MPPSIYGAAWVVMALAYTYSGYTKLVSPSWIDGTAFGRVLDNPLARPTFLRAALLSLPNWLLCVATWGGLLLELTFAPLALFPRLRPWLWTLMVGLHFTLLVLIDFADLSLGMLMMHLFTFDPAWVKPKPIASTELVFYDGHCGLCHRAVRFVLAEEKVSRTLPSQPCRSARTRTPIAETSSGSKCAWTRDSRLYRVHKLRPGSREPDISKAGTRRVCFAGCCRRSAPI